MTQNNQKCAEEYTVKRGDSFYLIAHKLGVPLRDLLAANRDIHPARLMVGDVLCIPREEDDAVTDDGSTGGDTTTDDANRPTDDLSTGTEQPPVLDTAPSCSQEDQFIVQRGQTVADIQMRALLNRHTLDEANPNVDLENLRVGQTICVPKENAACPVQPTYTLGTSETIESVAMQFGVSVAALLRSNPCLAPQDFTVGTTVIIP